jgi:O-antigen ligase
VGSVAGIVLLTIFFSFTILIIFSGTTIISLLSSNRILNRVKSIFSLENRSNYVRIKIWQGILSMIKDHFWFGTGPGNFSEVMYNYEILAEIEPTTPHSNYLNIITGWGIIGGFLFFGWIVYIMIKNWLEGMNYIQKIILAILLAFWVHVIFNDLISAYAAVLLGCLDNPVLKKEMK